MSAVSSCPGCGLARGDGPTPAPPKYLASSGCHERYGELLARSYADPAYRAVHQLVVDAYVAQHPSTRDSEHLRQLALCLMTLDLFIERGHDVSRGPVLHKRMVGNLPTLPRLDPPVPLEGMTVSDVLAARGAEEHQALVWTWARTVWHAWGPHHHTIRQWNTHALGPALA